MAKQKKTTRKKSGARHPAGASPQDAEGKHLVIVESPTKARTINQYLGRDYHVMSSVGHVRDLPSRAPKGERKAWPVPGVDLEHDFQPHYEVLTDKKKVVSDLKKAAKKAQDVWFATDLDREGEAIAWHLADEIGVDLEKARRVVFNAITKGEIQHAFENPREIDHARVDAQQARRILDRIVGYRVSPFLWKKVAGGLSAGRVQSVATRLVVEREREIEAFVPEEYWKVTGYFAAEPDRAPALSADWLDWLAASGEGRPQKELARWLSEHACLAGELVEFRQKKFKTDDRQTALEAARSLGATIARTETSEDEKAKGPARHRVRYHRAPVQAPAPRFTVGSVQTKRTRANPPPPFITSTLQQQASNRLGFPLQRTMRIAQQLYEGIDLKQLGGQRGLITYMRTDSTHIAADALEMARATIGKTCGEAYLPERPRFYKSSNKSAQEAHEAIRPTDTSLEPAKVKPYLTEEQFKLYELIWKRFVACQMTPAEWDATTILIHPAEDPELATFRATGRQLAFDGFYRVAGVPASDEVTLPESLGEDDPLGAIDLAPTQHFTQPPPRYTEASLQKKLEQEGIGRPSTYAAIISTIQDRKYVEPLAPRDRRLMATDLGKVVTDMLVEALPEVMDVAYTRQMESELDEVEEGHEDWVKMLKRFYGPFSEKLEKAFEDVTHAKAVTEKAPHTCPECGAGTMYRFGKNGRFLSCETYPECKYAAPIDREGNPQQAEQTNILCPLCGDRTNKRTGRFGPFLSCVKYPECKGIVNLDRKGAVKLPKSPPLEIELQCPKCEASMNLRRSKRGPWLSCSRFPKCRGRLGFTKLDEATQASLEKQLEAHEKAHPAPVVKRVDGTPVADGEVPEVVET